MDQINRIWLGGQRVTQVHWKPFSLSNKTKKVKDYSRNKEGYVTIYKKNFLLGEVTVKANGWKSPSVRPLSRGTAVTLSYCHAPNCGWLHIIGCHDWRCEQKNNRNKDSKQCLQCSKQLSKPSEIRCSHVVPIHFALTKRERENTLNHDCRWKL